MSPSKELVFSVVEGNIPIALDVTIPASACTTNKVPILVWWHGGGLLRGSRKAQAPHMLRAPEKHKIAVVAADYRVAPQTRFPGILTDISALMKYLRSPEFDVATGHCLNISKIIVSGSSAGGWLSLLAGTGIGFGACGVEVPERPLGICAIYPITDLIDPFWTTKQHPVSYRSDVVDFKEIAEYLDPKSGTSVGNLTGDPRNLMYTYMIQEAILADLLLDGTNIPPEAFSIAQNIASGQFKAPATFIIHGTVDDRVPYNQASDAVEAFKSQGIPVDMVTVEGKNHSFDAEESCEMEEMYAFIKKITS